MPTLDDEVMRFVADFTGVKRERLSPATTLFGDLGVDGADGWELVEAFGKRFQVNLSTFRADRHFGPEGLPVWGPLVWFCLVATWPFRKRKSPEEEAGLMAISIGDLVAAAREERWLL